MRKGSTGRKLLSAPGGLASLAAVLLLPLALAACTTVEGTNALTDVGTFEREVMTSTLVGVGVIPGQKKETITAPRAPLVLPRDASTLPAPQTPTATAMLPVDSGTVRIDASGLTEADLMRLRSAKVVDLRSLSGRPLTDAEAKQLTARMIAANKTVTVDGKRPLYLPPDEYFTVVKGQSLVCLARNGELVALSDSKCPAEIRAALQR